MNAIATTTGVLSRSRSGFDLRRSPLLLAAVVTVHALLVLVAVQSVLVVSMPNTLPESSRAGGGSRLQVLLLESPPAPTMIAETPPPMILAAESVTLPELPPIVAPTDAEDPLTGRYVGQLRARIARAWEALQTGAVPVMPDCLVRIEQTHRGELIGVDLNGCRVDAATGALLIRAIRAAAPLPAPPSTLAAQSTVELSLGARP